MLALSRNIMETIVIEVGGEVIRMTIVEVRGNKVRLSFEAGPYVRIDREEIWIKNNQQGDKK